MKYLLFILFFIILLSCDNQNVESQSSESFDTIKMKYAKWFKIIESDDSKYIILENPWEDNSFYAKYRIDTLEINEFALLSVSDIGYFTELKNLNKISGIADFHLIYNKELNARIEANKVQNLGLSADINKESLLSLMPEAFVEPAFQNHNLSNKILKESGILIIYNLDWLEEHPLGRAEWIKFFAAFTNQSQKADSIFAEVEAKYIELANQASKLKSKPDAIIGTSYKGVWYMPSGNSFKAQLLADAGVNYHWKNTEKSGSLALNFENVLKEQNDAEFWIDIPFNTKKQLLSVDQSYELFNAFKSGNLFNNLKRSKSSGANEYWEYAFVRPDILLNDLVQIFHSDSIDTEDLVFYQRLENE